MFYGLIMACSPLDPTFCSLAYREYETTEECFSEWEDLYEEQHREIQFDVGDTEAQIIQVCAQVDFIYDTWPILWRMLPTIPV